MLPLLRHARYVLSENPVTGLAFGLFAMFLLAAILGPALAPYSPLQSNAAMTLKPPSAAHWFGTDQLGRDILSRIIVPPASISATAPCSSLPPAIMAAGLTASSAAPSTRSWPSRCSCWQWVSSRRSAQRRRVVNIVYATAISSMRPRSSTCRSMPLRPCARWDNRCAMHRRDSFDPSMSRLMPRTQIEGTDPV